MKSCSQRVIKFRHKRASAGRSLIEEELVFFEGGVGGAGVGSSRTPLDCRTHQWGSCWFEEPAWPSATSHTSYEDTIINDVTHVSVRSSYRMMCQKLSQVGCDHPQRKKKNTQ